MPRPWRTKPRRRRGCRERTVHTFLQDLRFAWRAARRNPVPATAAIVCLALGVGLNTTIFSLVHALLLRPLPFADSSRLVALHWARVHFGHDEDRLSYLSYRDLVRQARVFSSLAAYDDRSFQFFVIDQVQSFDRPLGEILRIAASHGHQHAMSGGREFAFPFPPRVEFPPQQTVRRP